MDEFLEDLKSGEIQFRDRWQFELKSEFSPKSAQLESSYVQEFYFFIPNSLQITPETYTKDDFYKDLTNIIRYTTPVISLKELIDDKNWNSPLYQLQHASTEWDNKQLQNELKILGNVFRSSLKKEIQHILNFSLPPEKEVRTLCSQIRQFRTIFQTLKFKDNPEIIETLGYLDEFIGNSIDYFLTGLLDEFQMHHTPVSKDIEDPIAELVIEENYLREKTHHAVIKFSTSSARDDQILYRIGLLKKYFLDALLLRVDRTSIQEQYGAWISSFSAAIAMFVYLSLFIWQGQWFVINSFPFVFITVAAYVLKDRLKEGLKGLSYKRALWYFSDYTTKILSPQEDVIGELRESFTFVDEEKIPDEIRKIRNFEFHAMLKSFKRPEQVIYFKRIIKTFSPLNKKNSRLKSLNVSLRYNLQDFLEKASDPYHSYTTLDSVTRTVLKLRLPKVYHLNVILKSQFKDEKDQPVIELQKFRIILDKNGIKNIEQIRT